MSSIISQKSQCVNSIKSVDSPHRRFPTFSTVKTSMRSKFQKLPPFLRRGSGRASHLILMSALSSLSALLPSRPTFLKDTPVSNPRLTPCSRIQSFTKFSARKNLYTPPSSEKKSLGVATGEFFLGLVSILIKNRIENRGSPTIWNDMEEDFGVPGDAEARIRGRREGIASVVRDMADQDVVWEQRLKDVEAERERKKVTSPGFSFSAAGLLLPYHLGVGQYLIEKGYIKESTPLAGSSAGAIACAIIASGVSMHEALKATKVLTEDCRLKGTAFRLGAVLRDVLNEFLPEDIHNRSNGRLRVAVTQLLWRPRGLLVDQFDSKQDFINALFTSSFIPGYLAPRPATYFRKKLCIDGGLTLFMPPTSASNTIRVCAFPASRLGLEGIGISPDCNPEKRATPRQLLNWALEPAEDDILDNLFELGYLDAAVWGDQNPVDKIMQDESINESTS